MRYDTLYPQVADPRNADPRHGEQRTPVSAAPLAGFDGGGPPEPPAPRPRRWWLSWRWISRGLAALIVLVPCTFVDFGAVAARWNVRTDSPERVDLCYLQQVGPAALLPLIELERRPLTPAKRDRVRAVSERVLADLSFRQRDWRSWTPRGARRLTLAMARLGPDRAMPVEVRKGAWQTCDCSTAYAEPGTRP